MPWASPAIALGEGLRGNATLEELGLGCLYDDDGSGDLSIEELDPLIREIGYIPSQAMLKELCRSPAASGSYWLSAARAEPVPRRSRPWYRRRGQIFAYTAYL